jgi:hypothetical protein
MHAPPSWTGCGYPRERVHRSPVSLATCLATLLWVGGAFISVTRAAPGTPAAPVASAARAAPVATAEPPRPRTGGVRVTGLTGTLNKDDVHQTMEARQPAFDDCIDQVRRRLRWISGSIRFAFAVGADGSVEELHPSESNVGHRALEQCLYDATAATVFPKPAGRATARFEWTVHVEPAGGRWPTLLDTSVVERALHRFGPRIARECDLKRRERLRVTAYVNPRGRVISTGAIAGATTAPQKVECALGAIAKWRLPRVKRTGKVAFDLP